MPVINPWKSYRQTATLTAPPGQIILMLYDGALRSLERALSGFSHEDPAQRNMAVNNNLQRAQEFIRELNLALDVDRGGELAQTLRRLYAYFDGRIVASNLKKKRDGAEEVIRHLTILRDAWASMLKNQDPSFVSPPRPAQNFALA